MNFDKIIENPNRPFVIAGPCSAETEGQVMATAKALAQQPVDLFRAGIWKPRTRPGSFEGVGKEGLKWLKRVKEETGMKVTTEVAKSSHVYEAIKHGVDVLWIGARTTVNPFSVQEIADAVSGMDIPVLIKNPINPDLSLWKGAIERIYKAGITKIGVIHRGFSYHGKTKFRNVPRWQIAIDLKREFPDLMMICDNSHICGRRDLLQQVAQEALDLNYDGVMTEVHPRPDEAWSDAAQQITPDRFQELMSSLILRQELAEDSSLSAHIDDLRQGIDELDDELLHILVKRMSLADEIGRYKKRNNLSILQTSRWNEILEQSLEKARQHGLSDVFMNKLLRAVHQESIDRQERIMNGE